MNSKFIILGKAKVTFNHEYELRNVVDKKSSLVSLVSYPVATRVLVETEGGKYHAKVSPFYKQPFTFEGGRKYALKKALAQDKKLTKEERRRIWEEYNKLKPGGRW